MKGATSIQERLWELRKDKGLNLEELSELTGISKSALGSYEKEDYKEINHGNLITLADFIRILSSFLRILRFMWMGLPPCRFKTSTPLSILSGMKSLNGIAPAKTTRI